MAQARLFSDLLELAAIPAPTGDEEARIEWLARRTQNDESPVGEISIAKLGAARIAVEVADECIQIHGGAGYVTEYGIERSSRDLQLDRIGAGRDEIILEVIGRSYGCEGGGPVMSGLCLGQNTPRLDHRA